MHKSLFGVTAFLVGLPAAMALPTGIPSSNAIVFTVEPTVVEAPKPMVNAGPGISAAHFFDGSVGAFESVKLRSDFVLRSEPNREKSRKLGSVADAILKDSLYLTGKTRETVESDGSSGKWIQVFHGETVAWINRDAVVGSLPFVATYAKAPAAKAPDNKVVQTAPAKPIELAREVARPQTKPAVAPVAVKPPAPVLAPVAVATKPAVPVAAMAPEKIRAPAARTIAPVVPAAPPGPACVTTQVEYQKSERFQKALTGVNPFTDWHGPMGASITIGAGGSAVLHHPFKGAIPLNVSLCLDRDNTPYIGVNGNTVYFEGPGFQKVSIADPDSNQRYSFTRSAQ